jgi:hypothetical protein
MSAAQHKAVALMPWQMRLQRPRWLLHQIGAAAALLLLAALIRYVGALSWGGLAGVCALLALALLSWTLIHGLLVQNTVALAHLLPGHTTRLRQQLLGQTLLIALLVALLLQLMLAMGWRGWWLALLVQALFLALQREPLLWLPVALGFNWVWRNMKWAIETLPAAPWLWQLATLLLILMLVAAGIGHGGRHHRRAQETLRRWNSIWVAASEGRPLPWVPLGRWQQRLGLCFTWPQWWWHRLQLAHARPANHLARLELGLGTGGRWAGMLWQVSLVAAIVWGAVWLSLVWRSAAAHSISWQQLLDQARFGLCIGTYSVLAGLMQGRVSALWTRRREQALLVLLPGPPQGAALTGALERSWRREYLLLWALLTLLLLAVAVAAGPRTLSFVAGSAACMLPLVWWVQHVQRRLCAAPGMHWWMFAPLLSAATAALARELEVPVWFSLAVGVLVYALCAWRNRPPPVLLPLGRKPSGSVNRP